MPDGSPNVTPVWIGAKEGDRILIGTNEDSLKARNLRRDPRLGLSVVDFHDPYEEVQIRGHVSEFRDDSKLEVMDAISHKYIGADFPMRGSERDVSRWSSRWKKRDTRSSPFKHTPPQS